MFVHQIVRTRIRQASIWFKAIVSMLALTICPPPPAYPQSPAPAASPTAQAQPRPPVKHTSMFRSQSTNPRARDFYQLVWGIDTLKVKAVESGQMIRFSYLVLDPNKAAQLNDKKATPYLVDEKARVRLVVPTVEKVGQLRQSSTPEAGRSYWMVFSNKGRLVKPGDSVSIVIGKFRVSGLFVQ